MKRGTEGREEASATRSFPVWKIEKQNKEEMFLAIQKDFLNLNMLQKILTER